MGQLEHNVKMFFLAREEKKKLPLYDGWCKNESTAFLLKKMEFTEDVFLLGDNEFTGPTAPLLSPFN